MNKKADTQWYLVGFILALIVLIVLGLVFKTQVSTLAQKYMGLGNECSALMNRQCASSSPGEGWTEVGSAGCKSSEICYEKTTTG